MSVATSPISSGSEVDTSKQQRVKSILETYRAYSDLLDSSFLDNALVCKQSTILQASLAPYALRVKQSRKLAKLKSKSVGKEGGEKEKEEKEKQKQKRARGKRYGLFRISNQILGKGAFGLVHQVIIKDDLVPLACKLSHECVEQTIVEISLLHSLSHPNIVAPLAIMMPDYFRIERLEYALDRVAMIMPCAQPLRIQSIHSIVPVFAQLLDGVRALHSMRILHRDLKSPNAMQFPDGRVKWIDFGMSTQLCGQPLTSLAYTEPMRPPEIAMPQADRCIAEFVRHSNKFVEAIKWTGKVRRFYTAREVELARVHKDENEWEEPRLCFMLHSHLTSEQRRELDANLVGFQFRFGGEDGKELQLLMNWSNAGANYIQSIRLDDVHYGLGADVWSLALTFFSLLVNDASLMNSNQLLKRGVVEMREALLTRFFDSSLVTSKDHVVPVNFKSADIVKSRPTLDVAFLRHHLTLALTALVQREDNGTQTGQGEGAGAVSEQDVSTLVDQLVDLLSGMLEWEPWKRKGAEQLVTHPFFAPYGDQFYGVSFRPTHPYAHIEVPSLARACIIKTIVLWNKTQYNINWEWDENASIPDAFNKLEGGDLYQRHVYEKAIGMWQRSVFRQLEFCDAEIPLVALAIATLAIYSIFNDEQCWEEDLKDILEHWTEVGDCGESDALVFTCWTLQELLQCEADKGGEEKRKSEGEENEREKEGEEAPSNETAQSVKTDSVQTPIKSVKETRSEILKKQEKYLSGKVHIQYQVVRFIQSQVLVALDYQLYNV